MGGRQIGKQTGRLPDVQVALNPFPFKEMSVLNLRKSVLPEEVMDDGVWLPHSRPSTGAVSSFPSRIW